MDVPQLRIDDLTLTAPSVDDAEDWAAAQDDECARWFDWPSRPTPERCLDHLRDLTANPEPNSWAWAIRTSQGFVGGIDLKLVEDRWNVSYFVHPGHRGQGIARRALRAVVDWAVEQLRPREISTTVHIGNTASQKVLEAAGFTRLRAEQNPVADHEDLVYRLTRWRASPRASTAASTSSGRIPVVSSNS